MTISIDGNGVQRGGQRRVYDRRDGKIAHRVQVAAYQDGAFIAHQAVGGRALLDGPSASQDQGGMEVIGRRRREERMLPCRGVEQLMRMSCRDAPGVRSKVAVFTGGGELLPQRLEKRVAGIDGAVRGEGT